MVAIDIYQFDVGDLIFSIWLESQHVLILGNKLPIVYTGVYDQSHSLIMLRFELIAGISITGMIQLIESGMLTRRIQMAMIMTTSIGITTLQLLFLIIKHD